MKVFPKKGAPSLFNDISNRYCTLFWKTKAASDGRYLQYPVVLNFWDFQKIYERSRLQRFWEDTQPTRVPEWTFNSSWGLDFPWHNPIFIIILIISNQSSSNLCPGGYIMKIHLKMCTPISWQDAVFLLGVRYLFQRKPNPSWDEDGKPRVLLFPCWTFFKASCFWKTDGLPSVTS